MNPQAFIISLRRCHDRVDNVRRLVEACPIPCQTWDAVDGRSLSDEEVERWYKPGRHQPTYPFSLTRGEVGAFLSHRAIWQRIVDADLPAGLVLEDDIEFGAGFTDALRLAIEHLPRVGYIQFQIRNRHRHAIEVANNSQYQIVRPDRIPLGAVAQLISRDAAECLLQATQTFDRPIDTFVQMHWLHGVDILIATPPCIREISSELGGSMIHVHKTHRSNWDALLREWKRYRYQQQLQRLYRQFPIRTTGGNALRVA